MGKIMYKGENFPGGPNLLSELRDVNFSNVQDKQIILYDSTSRTWKNHTITAADVAYDENNSVAETISSLNSALDTISGALDNLKFKVYLNLQIPFSNSVDSGFNVSDVDANLANAKVLIPMCLGSFSSATMNGAKTFVAIHLIDTSPITATKSMNLLAVF